MNGFYDLIRSRLSLLPQLQNNGIADPALMSSEINPDAIMPRRVNQGQRFGREVGTPSFAPIKRPQNNGNGYNPTNGVIDYWKQPVFGKMPLDQFVTLAGMLAHSIAPNSWGGRMGAGLAQLSNQANQERIKQEWEQPWRDVAQAKAKDFQPIGPNQYGIDPNLSLEQAKDLYSITGREEPFAKASLEDFTPESRLKYLQTRDINNLVPINGIDKNQTIEQLTQTALFDPDPQKKEQAQKILDYMKQRDIDITGAKANASLEMKTKDIDLDGIANAIGEGREARVAVKGSMGIPVASQAESKVLQKYPKFDFNKSDANYKWANSAVNMRTISYIEGSLPRIAMLAEQSKKLGNSNFNVWNKVWNEVNKQFGKPEVTNFESNRNAIVQEINTALSGSSTGSDLRVKIELENLSNARSPQQMLGAMSNLNEALLARMDANMSPLYPIEVVQGKMTMEQYRDNVRRKYRGAFGKQAEGGGGGVKIPGNVPPINLLKEGVNTTFKNGQVWTLKNGETVRIK